MLPSQAQFFGAGRPMRRRALITLLGAAAAWPLAARAQQAAAVKRVGVLMLYEKDNAEGQALFGAFRTALTKLGWTEDGNVRFEMRWPGTDPGRVRQDAHDLIALQPDVILSSSSPTTAALLKQTRTIPVVFAQLVDPVAQGFVASLSRPGGNATGLVNLETSMAGKLIELLKQVMPGLHQVAVPYNPESTPYAELYLNYFKPAAAALSVGLNAVTVADLAALESFAAAQPQDSGVGVILMPSAFISGNVEEVAAMMSRHRLPALFTLREFAKAGGLLSYGNDISDNFRRAATFVDQILKGAKPSELPVQFPVKFELVINLKTARALGLTVPASLLATADEVIE